MQPRTAVLCHLRPEVFEAMIRITEASAKMRLREYADEQDCDMGIR